MSIQNDNNLIRALDRIAADGERMTEEVKQATSDLKAVNEAIPPERLTQLRRDFEMKLYARGGSTDGNARRELIAGVERGCK